MQGKIVTTLISKTLCQILPYIHQKISFSEHLKLRMHKYLTNSYTGKFCLAFSNWFIHASKIANAVFIHVYLN